MGEAAAPDRRRDADRTRQEITDLNVPAYQTGVGGQGLGNVFYIREGEAIGTYCGEPLYHASLDASEYEQLLAGHGFTLVAFVDTDPECGGHTVWLATHGVAMQR